MNRVAYCKNLEVVANALDELGLHEQADICTQDIKKIASGEMSVREAQLRLPKLPKLPFKLPNIGKMLGIAGIEKAFRPLYKPILIAAVAYYGGTALLKAVGEDPSILNNAGKFANKVQQMFGKKGIQILRNIGRHVENQAATVGTKMITDTTKKVLQPNLPGQVVQPTATQSGVQSYTYPTMAQDVQIVVNYFKTNPALTPQQKQQEINKYKQAIQSYLKANPTSATQQANAFESEVKRQTGNF
jgi:hypothetical protein